jgi:2-oxoglutarate ferredoxin oxidoreductase subunit alpha
MRTLLINELEIDPRRLIPVLNYDGTPITADRIRSQLAADLATGSRAPVEANNHRPH